MGGTTPVGGERGRRTPDHEHVTLQEPPERGRFEAPGARRARLVVAAGLLPVMLLAALDQMTVATALPVIAGELHGADRMSWVITAPLLASASALPVYARLVDPYGRRGVLQFAIVALVAGSALAGRAATMDQLIAFRALQGVGAGGLMIGVQAVAADIVPPRERVRATGLIGAVFGVASFAGPLLGGYFTDHLSWRWCFHVNVPLGLVALAVVTFAPKPPAPAARARPDVPGALLLSAVPTCLVLLAAWGGTEYAWGSRVVLGLGAGAVAAAALLLVVGRLAPRPLLPPRLFRDRAFNVTAVVGAAVGAALFATAGYLPTHLQMVEGVSATGAGLLMLPMTGGIVGASVVAGRLIRRTGRHRPYPVLGCALAAAGMWLLSRLEPGTPRLHFGLWTALLGAGLGLVMPVLVLAVQKSVRPHDLPTATAVGDCFRQLGGGVGAAACGAVLASRLADVRAPGGPARAGAPDPGSLTPRLVHALPAELRDGYVAAYADAVPRVFLHLVPVLVLGLLVACFLKEEPPVPHDTPAADPVPHDTPAADPVPGPVDSPVPRARSPHGAGAAVWGAVRHPDGTAVPRAALTLIDVVGRQTGRATSGEDGRYGLATPGPGAYVLIAAAGGHQPQAVGITVGEGPVALDLVLGGAGRLAGRVVTADGAPVRDAIVTLTDVHGEVVTATRSGREGAYAVAELAAGEYTLAASAPALRPAAVPVGVRAARETRQDIELSGGAVLRGTVRAIGGRPVEDARVTLLDAAGNVVATVTTAGDGAFRFVDLPSGEYTVIAAGYPPVATVLQVAGGGRTERDLRLGH
ncbi:MFS transporter [Streptomyces fructofermentans]|uniref:alpha-amylase n=1 Tax=Streptomyces fructofermentans TaxID=152141 RepID=A0A918K8R6_9ACTN|nr:MFS transporter [Streptomyces fructofermentans]